MTRRKNRRVGLQLPWYEVPDLLNRVEQTFQLFYMQGLDAVEIAAKLDVSRRTVYNDIRRAQELMQGEILGQVVEMRDAALRARREIFIELMNTLTALRKSRSRHPLSGGEMIIDPQQAKAEREIIAEMRRNQTEIEMLMGIKKQPATSTSGPGDHKKEGDKVLIVVNAGGDKKIIDAKTLAIE